MAKKPSPHEEWLYSQSRIKEAERAAGIAEALHELNERNAFITNAEKHAEDERKIIFGVADIEARKRVIHAYRDCHRLCVAYHEDEVRKLRELVRDNGEKSRSSAMWGAIAFAVVGVFAGNALYGLLGAIIAATAVILIGLDHLMRADRYARAMVENAKNEIEDNVKFIREMGADGIFSDTEEKTGLADTPEARALRANS